MSWSHVVGEVGGGDDVLGIGKARAKARGIPYQRFIREALEHAVAQK